MASRDDLATSRDDLEILSFMLRKSTISDLATSRDDLATSRDDLASDPDD